MLKYLHLMVFCIVAILFCIGSLIYKEVNQIDTNTLATNSMSAQKDSELPEIFSHIPPSNNSAVKAYTEEDVLLEYRALYDKNSDFAGWLTIDEIISLPVMHTPNNPEFYLTHDVEKRKKKYGAPFIDARCSFNPQSDNLIIHGHNMNDKTMFSPLMHYMKEDFYNKHKKIEFNTLYEKNEYEVYAVFISTFGDDDIGKNSYYNTIDFANEDRFDSFVAEVASQSLYKSEIKPKYGDRIITLMTCTNRDDDERMNVVAVKKLNP